MMRFDKSAVVKTVRLSGFVLMLMLCFQPDANADWLLLLHADSGGKFDGQWEAKVETELKFRENMSEFYDLEAMPWVAYSKTPRFKIGFGWRELFGRMDCDFYKRQAVENEEESAYRKISNHYWQVEHRPLVDFIFTFVPMDWTVEDRMRVELRILEVMDPFFRLRNRLKLTPPWKWTKAEFQLWIAWEAYYEFNPNIMWSERLTRNRFFAGLGLKAAPNIKFGLYYYWEAALLFRKWCFNNEIGFGPSLAF